MKPILFNTPMVQAILDGRKTQTRRLIKPQPLFFTGRNYIFADETCPKKWEDCNNFVATAPYQPGDILYIRETWAQIGTDVDKIYFEEPDKLYDGMYIYKADGINLSDIGHWHPSIHMPKEAARIFLRVTNVRVERLQEIDDEGAKREGANFGAGVDEKMRRTAIERFAEIFDSTIKPADRDRYSWDANPWVWVYEFEQISESEIYKNDT